MLQVGDKTKGGLPVTAVKVDKDGFQWVQVEGHTAWYDAKSLEPSVPVSKIREVCEGLMHKHITNDHDAGWNLAIEVLRDHLTGE